MSLKYSYVPPDTLANEKTFHPEITRSFAAFIPVEGAVVEAIGDFVRKLPKDQMTDVRRAGLKEARLGISRQFTGLLMVMTDGAAGDEAGNALVARAIAAAAPALAGAFGLGERAKLALALHGAADKLSGPAQADIAATAKAFEGRGCEALCAIE